MSAGKNNTTEVNSGIPSIEKWIGVMFESKIKNN